MCCAVNCFTALVEPLGGVYIGSGDAAQSKPTLFVVSCGEGHLDMRTADKVLQTLQAQEDGQSGLPSPATVISEKNYVMVCHGHQQLSESEYFCRIFLLVTAQNVHTLCLFFTDCLVFLFSEHAMFYLAIHVPYSVLLILTHHVWFTAILFSATPNDACPYIPLVHVDG